jgi:hypothetical protein
VIAGPTDLRMASHAGEMPPESRGRRWGWGRPPDSLLTSRRLMGGVETAVAEGLQIEGDRRILGPRTGVRGGETLADRIAACSQRATSGLARLRLKRPNAWPTNELHRATGQTADHSRCTAAASRAYSIEIAEEGTQGSQLCEHLPRRSAWAGLSHLRVRVESRSGLRPVEGPGRPLRSARPAPA